MLNKLLPLAALAASLAGGVFVSPLRADEFNHETNITINQPISIEGTLLQPGSYVLKLLDNGSEPGVMQVFDRSGVHLITTVLPLPAYREDPTDHSEFSFYERPANQPAPLHTWFYPGENAGFEFPNTSGE